MQIISDATVKIMGERYTCFEEYTGGVPQCAMCGNQNIRQLVLDHVNGGGCEERRKYTLGLGGHHYYSHLRRLGYPKNPPLQVLCTACHTEKSRQERRVDLSQPTTIIFPSDYHIEPIIARPQTIEWED